jgi:hypothetical protein
MAFVLKARPAEHAGNETTMLSHGTKGIRHLSAENTKNAGVEIDGIVREKIDQPVDQFGTFVFDERLPRHSFGVDHIKSLKVGVDQVRDEFRGVLQITVHHDDVIPAAMVDAGRKGLVMSESFESETGHEPACRRSISGE